MADTLALTVLFAVALSCSAFVLLLDALRPIIVAYLKSLWARLKAGDDPFGDGADGDEGVLPQDFKLLHSACVTDGGQPNNGAR